MDVTCGSSDERSLEPRTQTMHAVSSLTTYTDYRVGQKSKLLYCGL